MTLISAEKIKQIVPISQNIDDNLFTSYLQLTEIKHILPVLGPLLYTDIVNKFNSQTLNQIETTLVGMIQIPLAFYVVNSILPMLTYTITEKGLQSQVGVNSDNVDNKGESVNLTYVRKELTNNGEYFLQQINEFLNSNTALFPLYRTVGN